MPPEHLQQLERVVGFRLRPLLVDAVSTEEYLYGPDPKTRYAALILMTYHWTPTDEFKVTCEHMALLDRDVLVRSTAIGCLGNCFTRTGNRRIEKLLANIVRNEAQPYQVRRSAYMSLFIVSTDCYEVMPPGEVWTNLRIPEGVDWAFVNSKLM